MKSLFALALRRVRTDLDTQDALVCSLCWASFATVVVAAVAMPA